MRQTRATMMWSGEMRSRVMRSGMVNARPVRNRRRDTGWQTKEKKASERDKSKLMFHGGI